MTERDQLRLKGTHPKLITVIGVIIRTMEAMGYPVFVVEGLRTLERQQQLYAQGRSKPGRRVTNADGVRNPSNHQAKDTGYGHAVDLAFVDNPLTPETVETWDPTMPWSVFGEIATYHGCEWGGNWSSKNTDRPHVQLPT
jgi:hypothetical protein